MRALGIFLSKEQVRQTMEKADKDGSGTMNCQEFKGFMAEFIFYRNQQEELKKVFRMYDDNEDGVISSQDLKLCA